VKLILSVVLLSSIVVHSTRAQSPLDEIPILNWLSGRTVVVTQGVAPHQRFKDHFYRAFALGGVNAGLINDAPTAGALLGSYQVDHQVVTGGFITSSSNGGLRKTWIEGDLLYGYAWNGYDFGFFSKGATDLSVTASAGLSFVTYDIRYRRGRFDPQASPSFLAPNTFQYAVGVPVQLQASYAITRFLGVTALFYANINKIQISYGAMAGVMVGWF
jgi:hypothetical protein